jgi:DNA-binding NarL/FixJ family response regulator
MGFPVRGARLFGAAEALRERAGVPVSQSGQESYRSSVAGIQRSLTMRQFATAWAEGRALSTEAVIDLGLDDIGVPDRIVGGLSRRELQVLRLVAQGLTDREIADRLYISRRTASDHVSHILEKLDVATRQDAKAWAMTHSLA